MNMVQTALVFVGMPLGLTALLALGVYGKASMRRERYRPGRPWNYPAVWYVPHPGAIAAPPAASTDVPALGSGTSAAPERYGGASGEW